MSEAEVLRFETFEPHVDSVFSLEAGEVVIDLVLLEVKDRSDLMMGSKLPDGSSPYERSPFTLTFSGPRDPLVSGAVHRLVHASLGTVEMHLKPFAQGDKASFYEAVFN